jgi:hypothetical protein
MRTAEGMMMIAAGASMAISTSPTGFGIVFGAAMALKGLDNVFAGVDEFSNGRERRTFSHRALAWAFGSCEAADHAEQLIDAVFIATVISKWPEADFARGNCFPAGTPVATERGAVPIEEVESGERVWSFDFRAGQWVLCRVALVHSAPYEGEVLTLLFEDGTSLEVTADHPVWVIEGDGLATRPQLHFRDANEDSGLTLPGRWVHSQALRVGDQLCGRDGRQVRIRAIRSRQDNLPVYNLSVLGLPYYAVGSGGILVHNTESIPPTGKPGQAARRGSVEVLDLPTAKQLKPQNPSERITLYHGTNNEGVEGILSKGIVETSGGGEAFPVTTRPEIATRYAERVAERYGGEPQVLKMEIPYDDFVNLFMSKAIEAHSVLQDSYNVLAKGAEAINAILGLTK